MTEYDPGPPRAVADHFAALPSYADHRDLFWYDWGPVFYRGRLDTSAKVLAIASDPGPTERIACRTLVGDAGQRVQGFLSKLGLDHSYVLVNAFPYALHPSRAQEALPLLATDPFKTWNNRLFDLVTGPALQAVVTFGVNAREAYGRWNDAPDVPVFGVPHPSSHNTRDLLDRWRAAIAELRDVVTPDPGRSNTSPNYGQSFTEADYTAIPAPDLPFGLPEWFGDDRWGRQAHPRHNNSVERPTTDPENTLVWQAPRRAD
ncbi:uracil-DNA glycosylase family protein [Xylanimonas sp. McL0601]|uniref:uracil-DNA glycosylase family protein n=1 Tax=Xylanimonas sp. McL0601 TaxID=3414739 RepID=UPI003CF02643